MAKSFASPPVSALEVFISLHRAQFLAVRFIIADSDFCGSVFVDRGGLVAAGYLTTSCFWRSLS